MCDYTAFQTPCEYNLHMSEIYLLQLYYLHIYLDMIHIYILLSNNVSI